MSAQNTNTDKHTDNNGAGHDDDPGSVSSQHTRTPSQTPRSSKSGFAAAVPLSDGAVLTEGCDGAAFIAHPTASNLSPILKLEQGVGGGLQNIDEASEEGSSLGSVAGGSGATGAKRKRESFDNVSLMSTDSMMLAPSGPFSSAKKPKLIRTGSITRGLRRSMSFVALKNPIATVLRSRRNSTVDPNASLTSVGSVDSHTFNESIRKPVAEKMRSLRNRIMKSNKRDITPKVSKAMVSQFRQLGDSNYDRDEPAADCVNACDDRNDGDDDDDVGGASTVTAAPAASDVPDFKTPIAPRSLSRFSQLVSSSSTRALFQRADRAATATTATATTAVTANVPTVVATSEPDYHDAAEAGQMIVVQQSDIEILMGDGEAAAEQNPAVQHFLLVS